MKTLLLWIGLLFLGNVLLSLSNNVYYFWDDLFFILGWVLIAIGIFSLILQPLFYYIHKSEIVSFETLVETLETARLKGHDNIENTNITLTISQYNSWLKRIQWANNTIFDWYIPDKIMELELIK